MPVRRLNYTDRQRIRRDDVKVMIRRGTGNALSFDASMQLTEYRFAVDARVILEAYRQTSLMRFDFGTINVPVQPEDRTLSLFENESEILFRLRVTSVSARSGLLLGEADQIRPLAPDEQPDRRIPLLPPVPGDIGQQVWRLEFEAGGPLLRINQALDDWKQTARSDAFRALVYPAALRQVLQQVLYRDEYRATDDFADWRSRWLLFSTRIPGVGNVPNSRDDYDEWIEEAVSAFARQFTFMTRYSAELRGNT